MKDNKEGAGKAPEEAGEGKGRTIYTKIDIDQRLNPDSPAFDPAAYQAFLDARGGLDEVVKDASKRINAGFDVLAKAFRNLPAGEAVNAAIAGTSQRLEELKGYMQSYTETVPIALEQLQAIIEDLKTTLTDGERQYREWLEELRAEGGHEHILFLADNMPFVTAGLIGFIGLAGQMGDYLEEELSKPEYEGHTMQALIMPLEDDPEATLWERAVANAEEAMKAAEPDRYRAMMEARGQQDTEEEKAQQGEQTTGAALAKTQLDPLAPLASMPNGEALNWLFRISASKGGRVVSKSPANRHEEVTIQKKGNRLRLTRTNKQTGSTTTVEIDQADKFLGKSNKTFVKMLSFTLQKMAQQNFPLIVGFPLQELVDVNMYGNTDSARRAVYSFAEHIIPILVYGSIKKGNKLLKENVGNLIYNIKIDGAFVRVYINENYNIRFLAPYFTVLPIFSYSLGTNAFFLVRYIFFLARQNSQAIKDKGAFTINLDSIREMLGLPAPDEVKNWKYKQYIMTPIEDAIEEIEEALQNVPEAREYGFTITPYGTAATNINEWLQGYLEIGLRGDFAETFVRLATKAERDRAKWEKAKLTEQARLTVKEEAKAAKEADKTTRGKAKGKTT